MPVRMGQMSPRHYTEENLREMADDLEKAVNAPVNVMVEAEHRGNDLSDIKEMLRDRYS